MAAVSGGSGREVQEGSQGLHLYYHPFQAQGDRFPLLQSIYYQVRCRRASAVKSGDSLHRFQYPDTQDDSLVEI
jgi:hypothetical protein